MVRLLYNFGNIILGFLLGVKRKKGGRVYTKIVTGIFKIDSVASAQPRLSFPAAAVS